MTIVVDASAVAAALVDGGSDGQWAAAEMAGDQLAAPHLMPIEVVSVLRRAVLAADLSADVATLAHDDLMELRVALFPYEALGGRVWQLRASVTAFDAWYVALAETLEVPLVTLDRRLARAPGPRCEFRLPPSCSGRHASRG